MSTITPAGSARPEAGSADNTGSGYNAGTVQRYWKEAFDAGVTHGHESFIQTFTTLINDVMDETAEALCKLADDLAQSHNITVETFFVRRSLSHPSVSALFVVPEAVFAEDRFLPVYSHCRSFLSDLDLRIRCHASFLPVAEGETIDVDAIKADGYMQTWTLVQETT